MANRMITKPIGSTEVQLTKLGRREYRVHANNVQFNYGPIGVVAATFTSYERAEQFIETELGIDTFKYFDLTD